MTPASEGAVERSPNLAVVLAAGKGSRLRSDQPKVLHSVAGRPSLAWVLDACRGAGCQRIFVVVGHGADEVREVFADAEDLEFVVQEEQRGTGHAVQAALPAVRRWLDGRQLLGLVVYGDNPLLRAATLRRLLETAAQGWGALSFAELPDPGDLGRVLVDDVGRFRRVVEVADATPEELAVRRVNPGQYALPFPGIEPFLEGLRSGNAQGELYLPEAVEAAAARGLAIGCVAVEDPTEAWGVNDRRDLAAAHARLVRRRVDELLDGGVTVLQPDRVEVCGEVEVEADCVLHPGVALLGRTRIGRGTVLHQGAWVRDSEVGSEVEVLPYSVLDSARVGDRCSVGPFARLRPGTELGTGARIGNFVETKNVRVGAGAKASHLAYLGDASVGAGANIGAGVVTCNYDGTSKHRTEIGEGAFVGSDTMLVAPVSVGRGATTGAGSVITKDVPDDALGIGRARQRNLEGWRRRGEGE